MSGPIINLPDFVAKKVERLRPTYQETQRVKQIMDEAKRRHYQGTAQASPNKS